MSQADSENWFLVEINCFVNSMAYDIGAGSRVRLIKKKMRQAANFAIHQNYSLRKHSIVKGNAASCSSIFF